MRYLVITPTEREYRNMSAAVQREGLKNSYTVARTGVGKALSAAGAALAIARANGDFDRVAIVGYAASTIGRQRGDIVAPRVARYYDCRIPGDFVPELTDPHPLLGHDDAMVLTGDSFVDGDMIRSVKAKMGVESALFDMEATSICQAAELFDLPVVVIKMVSDVPEEGDNEFSYDAFVDSHTDFSAFVDYLEKLR